MKHTFLLLIILVSKFCVLAQNNNQIFKFSDYYRKIIKIPEPTKVGCAITLFDKVILNDARYDTSAVAIARPNYYKIFGKTSSLERYLNLSLGLKDSNKLGNELVIFIKQLWLTNEFHRDSKDMNINILIPGIFFKIECFYKVDSFYLPAFKYDASFSYDTKEIIKYAPNLIDSCLKKIVGRIILFQNEGISSLKRKMTLQEVLRYYDNAVEIPILKDITLNKGVYLTYNDFKKNKPRYTSFEVQKRALNDIVYLKETGQKDILLENVWGYCDGDSLFIKSSSNFYPLCRNGNSFYFIKKYFVTSSVKTITPIYGASNHSLGNHESTISIQNSYQTIYQLDMETGVVF